MGTETKSYEISKRVVLEAYERVKANGGTYGVDKESLAAFEINLKNNLYKIWNRMSSGSYFPPAVRRVEIPKDGGKKRQLGIPTVSDRVAQMVAKIYLEPFIEPYFHEDSYGYRVGKSAHDAIGVARERCWRYDWVLDMDIQGFYDNIDHSLLMKAVRKHTDSPWLLLYIERWLKAPVEWSDGSVEERIKGTPQGGVISPLLANLFLHYAFDMWMRKNYPQIPFERYADDCIAHCKTEEVARKLKAALEKRFEEVGLQLHPEKTKIVYCKDGKRRETFEPISFDFLGYTFRPRKAKNRKGELFLSFLPGISGKAQKKLRSAIKGWKLHRRTGISLQEIASWINPIIRGWVNYYGKYYKSALTPILRQISWALVKWATRKFKRFRHKLQRAYHWLGKIAQMYPDLFVIWSLRVKPTTGR